MLGKSSISFDEIAILLLSLLTNSFNFFTKFNLNLEKKIYSSNWVALIFIRTG